jgi:hypothetical protein
MANVEVIACRHERTHSSDFVVPVRVIEQLEIFADVRVRHTCKDAGLALEQLKRSRDSAPRILRRSCSAKAVIPVS